jgi:type IV secretion system protein VirD4
MQLSPDEALVMVSGSHPVRARKVRYYEDPQFQRRILRPSRTTAAKETTRMDDWSGRKPIQPSIKLLAALKRSIRDQNGGIRREPELLSHEQVEVKAPFVENEFDAVGDEGDVDAVQVAALNQSMQSLARSVSLDPDDKMGL